MYVWFDTDAFVDYARLLSLDNKLMIKDWDEWRISRPRTGYLEFLVARNPTFLVRLVSCRHCLCFWLSLFMSIIVGCLVWLPLIYLTSLLGYKIYIWLVWILKKY